MSDVEIVRNKGGRPRKDAGGISDTAVEVSHGLTADAGISAHAGSGDDQKLRAAEIARIRAVRKPFGDLQQKLALPKRPGYHRHWFNDVAGRIDEAVSSGWTHVKGQDGKSLKRVVGSGRDKGALYAFAMEIPDVFWEEDMQARHDIAEAKLDGIKKSPFQARAGEAKAADKGKFYSPSEAADPLQITKGR